MIQALVRLAEKHGYVTFDQIVEALDDGEDRVALRNLLFELEDLGIELRKEAENAQAIDAKEKIEQECDGRKLSENRSTADIGANTSDEPGSYSFPQKTHEPLLTAEEEIDLAKRIERGFKARIRLDNPDVLQKSDRWGRHLRRLVLDGQRARESLARANTRLVASVAKQYMGLGLSFPDLRQEGYVGLMRAVDKYDYSFGNRFSTYATWWIRQSITRALSQKTRTIRLPLHVTERIRKLYRAAEELERKLGRRPALEEIASKMQLRTEAVQKLLDANQRALYFEELLTAVEPEKEQLEYDEDDYRFENPIEDREVLSQFDSYFSTQNLLEETIQEVLRELTPRQSHILRLRFGLGGGEPHTLEEIANKFGLSRERIRQLEKEALRRLRHPQLAHNLRDYLA